MVGVGLEVDLTAVCDVAVAVVIASIASDSANAIGTRGNSIHC
jgi:folylpolyglutamate synthase/dihydropteroate synthase